MVECGFDHLLLSTFNSLFLESLNPGQRVFDSLQEGLHSFIAGISSTKCGKD
jgi:hypothetical protein